MRIKIDPFVVVMFAAFALAAALFPANAAAQRRDYLTEAEIEIVRDAQDIDMRIDVLTKVIDRRLAVLNINASLPKAASKSSEKWGDPPTGTRLELLTDVKRLLQKAIDDVDDVAEHNSNTLTQNKVEGKLFPKAVRSLAAAAHRYLPAFQNELNRTADEKEKGALLDSIEFCSQIIEAVGKLPAEEKRSKN